VEKFNRGVPEREAGAYMLRLRCPEIKRKERRTLDKTG